MKTKFLYHCFFILFIIINLGCSDLYPIYKKNNLASTNSIVNEKYYTEFNHENFYQLRIKQVEEYIQFKVDTNSTPLISSTPFRRFKQHTSQQNDATINNPKTIEETYIYLDNLNQKDNKEIPAYGYAFYFVTFPTIDGYNPKFSKTDKYFNDNKSLYANTFRSVNIGYWVRNVSNKDSIELLLLFKRSKNEIFALNGRVYNNALRLDSISHPEKFMKKINGIDHSLYIRNYINHTKAYNMRPQAATPELLEEFYETAKRKIAFMPLKNVFDLDDGNELLFFQVPDSKKFILESKEDRSEGHIDKRKKLDINAFIIGQDSKKTVLLRKALPRFYISTQHEGKKHIYVFKRKNTSSYNKSIF